MCDSDPTSESASGSAVGTVGQLIAQDCVSRGAERPIIPAVHSEVFADSISRRAARFSVKADSGDGGAQGRRTASPGVPRGGRWAGAGAGARAARPGRGRSPGEAAAAAAAGATRAARAPRPGPALGAMSGGAPSGGGPGGSGRARTSSFAEPGGGGGGGGGGPGGSASGPGGSGGGKTSVGAMGGGVGASSSGGGPSGSGGGGSGGPGAGTSFPPPGVKLGREYYRRPWRVEIGFLKSLRRRSGFSLCLERSSRSLCLPKLGSELFPIPEKGIWGGYHHLEFRIRFSNSLRDRGHRFLFFQYRSLGSESLQNRDPMLPSIREQDQGSLSLANGAQGLLFPKRTRIRSSSSRRRDQNVLPFRAWGFGVNIT